MTLIHVKNFYKIVELFAFEETLKLSGVAIALIFS